MQTASNNKVILKQLHSLFSTLPGTLISVLLFSQFSPGSNLSLAFVWGWIFEDWNTRCEREQQEQVQPSLAHVPEVRAATWYPDPSDRAQNSAWHLWVMGGNVKWRLWAHGHGWGWSGLLRTIGALRDQTCQPFVFFMTATNRLLTFLQIIT